MEVERLQTAPGEQLALERVPALRVGEQDTEASFARTFAEDIVGDTVAHSKNIKINILYADLQQSARTKLELVGIEIADDFDFWV